MEKTIRRTFATGLIIVLPLLVTYWIIQFIFTTIDEAVTPLVLSVGLSRFGQEAWVLYMAPLLSVVLALLSIYVLGLVGGNVLGKQVIRFFERILMQVPFVRGIYSAARRFMDTFSPGDAQAFRRVVLVEYPRKGLWTVALQTNDGGPTIAGHAGGPVVSVFVPTTPNPTSGWLLYVRTSEVFELDISVDEAFQLIISGGVLTPRRVRDMSSPAGKASAPPPRSPAPPTLPEGGDKPPK